MWLTGHCWRRSRRLYLESQILQIIAVRNSALICVIWDSGVDAIPVGGLSGSGYRAAGDWNQRRGEGGWPFGKKPKVFWGLWPV